MPTLQLEDTRSSYKNIYFYIRKSKEMVDWFHKRNASTKIYSTVEIPI